MQALTMEAPTAWPYTNFGVPQTPVSQQDFSKAGFTRYTFSNGLKLNLKPTKFKDDQVLVSVNFKGGLESLPPLIADAVAFTNMFAGMGGFFAGGLGKLDVEQLQKLLAGKSLTMTYNIGEDATVLTGATTRRDTETQLQLLMAYVADPAFRPAVFGQIHGALPAIYAQFNGAPQNVLQSNLSGLTHDSDMRFAFPSFEEASAMTLDGVKSLIKASMTGKPLEITIVGDFDPAATLDVVSHTFATLPNVTETKVFAPDSNTTSFPEKAKAVVFTHKGRSDQSVSALVWPVPGELHDTQTSRVLEILTDILNHRAFATIRQTLGQAYDAAATRQQSWVFNDFGFIMVSASVAVGDDKAFVAAVYSLIEELKTQSVSQNELDRARKPILERWQTDQTNNQHWIYAIPPMTKNDTDRQSDAKTREELLKVTPDMVISVAKAWFIPDRLLHVQVLPESTILQ